MIILNVNNITVNFAGREIFRDLSWAVGDKDRIGLVGPNGAGKSSLMKVMVGKITPDSGHLTKSNKIEVGYLPQEIDLAPGITLLEAALVPPPRLARVEAEIDGLEDQLGQPAVYEDADKLAQVMDQLETVTALYDRLGGGSHHAKVEEVLYRLGFTDEEFHLPTDTLSGGQKKMVALARLVIGQPELLLLDEPDNHLDLDAKRHLEAFIRGYNGAVVIISHDRYLLDEVAKEIADLENGKLTLYKGNYSTYANERELARMRQQQQYLTQQKEITRIEEMIKQFELWAKVFDNERANKQARSRRKMLERMEANGEIIEKVNERRLMDLTLQGGRGSTKALAVESISMGFPTDDGDMDLIFLELDLLIRHGERVGLIGPNGAGKSVLFRLILGQLEPLEGEVKIGPSTRVGYYSQEHETLGKWEKRTPIDLIRDVKAVNEGGAVSNLLRFAFTYEQCRQPIRTLSGGERSRLQLLKLMLEGPNLLLLDEPTNNLDIQSAEVLETAINEFEGAVLTISHDRYFLDRVVDRVVELDHGALTGYLGGYTDYLGATGRIEA